MVLVALAGAGPAIQHRAEVGGRDWPLVASIFLRFQLCEAVVRRHRRTNLRPWCERIQRTEERQVPVPTDCVYATVVDRPPALVQPADRRKREPPRQARARHHLWTVTVLERYASALSGLGQRFDCNASDYHLYLLLVQNIRTGGRSILGEALICCGQ